MTLGCCMDPLHSLREEFDGGVCFRRYQEGADVSEMLSLLAPLIREVIIVHRFRPRSPDEYQDFHSAGFLRLCEALAESPEFRDEDELRIWFRSRVKAMLSHVYWQERRFYPRNGSEKFMLPQPDIKTADVERQIYLRQLRTMIYREVAKKIRFSGSERMACMFVLRRVIQGRRIMLRKLREQFNLENPMFYVQYITVLARDALYRVKEKEGAIPWSAWVV